MICLEELSASGKPVCTSTPCYHFFHLACIHSYVDHCRQEFEECQNERKNISNQIEEDNVFEVRLICIIFVFIILNTNVLNGILMISDKVWQWYK